MTFTYLARELAEQIHCSQFACLLPGHGQDSGRLRETTAQDWIRRVYEDYESVRRDYESVVVIGHSLGGLLAYGLAQERSPDGTVLLAPAFRYRFSWMKWGAETIGRVVPYVPQLGFDGLSDRTLEEFFAHYTWIPCSAVREISRLQEQYRDRYSPNRVSEPVLSLHSVSDTVIDHEQTVEWAREFRSPLSRYRAFKRSNHVLPLDYDREQVLREIVDFVNDCVARF